MILHGVIITQLGLLFATDRPEMTVLGSKKIGEAIRIQGLEMTYDSGSATVHALRGLDLHIPAGELLCLFGPSGSGKSTLLHLLAGLQTASAGQMWIGESNLSRLSETERTDFRRKHIGLVFQFFNLVPELTLRQNVALPLLMEGVPLRYLRERIDALLDRLGLGNRADHELRQLSGGQIQRVAIARALITEPRLILADEPTGNLDSANANDIFGLLRDLNDESGVTTILVTHDNNARDYADRTLVLEDGQIASSV